jgi:hypothetical protein
MSDESPRSSGGDSVNERIERKREELLRLAEAVGDAVRKPPSSSEGPPRVESPQEDARRLQIADAMAAAFRSLAPDWARFEVTGELPPCSFCGQGVSFAHGKDLSVEGPDVRICVDCARFAVSVAEGFEQPSGPAAE